MSGVGKKCHVVHGDNTDPMTGLSQLLDNALPAWSEAMDPMVLGILP
jgi:hypothetical protein